MEWTCKNPDCEARFSSPRPDARFCSVRCRVAEYRKSLTDMRDRLITDDVIDSIRELDD